MSIHAIERIGPVRIGGLADLYPSETLRALALNRAERVARTSPVDFPRVEGVQQQPPMAAKAPVQETDADDASKVGPTIDWLRNQYATHRLASAVQAFRDEQAALRDSGNTANDLGEPERPLLLQRYLVAFGNAPIERLQPAADPSAASARVGPVAGVAAARSTTEDALGADPQTRSRVRRLRETDA